MDFLANDYGLEISRYGINGDQLSPSGARIIMVAQDPRPQIKPWGPDEILSVTQSMGELDSRYRAGLTGVNFDTSKPNSSPTANLVLGSMGSSGNKLMCTINVGNLDVFTPETSTQSKETINGLRKFVLYHELAHCEQGAARTMAMERVKKVDFSFTPTVTTSILGELMFSFNRDKMTEVDGRQINDLNNERHSDSVALLKMSKDVLGNDASAPDFAQRMKTMESIYQQMNNVRIKMAKHTVDANGKAMDENCNTDMKATDIYKIANSNLEQLRIIKELSQHQVSKNTDRSLKDGGDIKPLKAFNNEIPGFKDFMDESKSQFSKAISMNDEHKNGEAQIYENFGKRDFDASGHENIKAIKAFNASASSIIQSCGVKGAAESKKSTIDLSMKPPVP